MHIIKQLHSNLMTPKPWQKTLNRAEGYFYNRWSDETLHGCILSIIFTFKYTSELVHRNPLRLHLKQQNILHRASWMLLVTVSLAVASDYFQKLTYWPGLGKSLCNHRTFHTVLFHLTYCILYCTAMHCIVLTLYSDQHWRSTYIAKCAAALRIPTHKDWINFLRSRTNNAKHKRAKNEKNPPTLRL